MMSPPASKIVYADFLMLIDFSKIYPDASNKLFSTFRRLPMPTNKKSILRHALYHIIGDQVLRELGIRSSNVHDNPKMV